MNDGSFEISPCGTVATWTIPQWLRLLMSEDQYKMVPLGDGWWTIDEKRLESGELKCLPGNN